MSKSIFLSHSHYDKDFALKLHVKLIHNGIKNWFDEAEIGPGVSLIDKVEQGIDEMDYLGVILSHNSVVSEWVKREVRMALNGEIANRSVKVIPILIEKCTIPGFLRDKKYVNFVDSFETGFDELIGFLSPDRFDEYSSFSLVSGFSLVAFYQNLCVKNNIDECKFEIETIDNALEKANVKFRAANFQEEIEGLFQFSRKQRIILVGKLAREWPDMITDDLKGYNSHLFTFGTLMTTPLFYDSMDSSQLEYFYSKLDTAYRNTALPQRFFNEFKQKIKTMSESNHTQDEYKAQIHQFGQKLIEYIDMVVNRK